MSTEAYRASLAYVMGVRVLALAIESVIYGVFAFAVSWEATVFAACASVVILLLSRGLVRMGRDGGVLQTQWYRQLLASLTDTLQSVKSFKAMGREHLADNVLSEETSALRGALRREALATASLESAQEPMYALVIAGGIYFAFSSLMCRWPPRPFSSSCSPICLSRLGRCRSSISAWPSTNRLFGRWTKPSAMPRARLR